MQREQLIAKIQGLGLSGFEDEILAAGRHCLSITTSPVSFPISPTDSKIGGTPELPPSVPWPRSQQGTPMLFLARIAGSDLRRIHPHLADRHLLFFGDWEHDTGGRIIEIAENAPAFPTATPERPPNTIQCLNECVAHITDAISLPSARDEFESWRYSEILRAFGARSEEIWEGYSITITPLGELIEQHYGSQTRSLARPHRVFGYPLYTQGHPAEVAEQRFKLHYTLSGEPKDQFVRSASRWVPVLSLETDDTAGLSFGDTGNCGFLVTDEALAAGAFDDAEFYQDNC
ncbi:MAG: hypothetical protein QOE70_1415 [Chthoniobacter sp.]|jgi:uncharacterized protein YwqG|nr:hypothetical protein [Chthoniobacter sp.]